jgi:quinol monooxygenase YgiN
VLVRHSHFGPVRALTIRQFLQCLHDVAEVTHASEPEARAYAWFRSAEDNDTVPHHWVRGFEVYAKLEASTETHRASAPYKDFRTACASEKLLDRPSDLRYMEPLGLGFMTRDWEPVVLQSQESQGYVVVERLKPKPGNRPQLLEAVRELSGHADAVGQGVHTFWSLGYRAEDNDETVVLFERFASKNAYTDYFLAQPKVVAARKHIADLCAEEQLTTWVDAGIGFIGR